MGFRGASADEEDKGRRQEALAQLHKVFPPEFINRIDEIILFRPLEAQDISQIAGNLIAGLKGRLEEKGIVLSVEPAALELVCRQGFDPLNGARPLARAIERLVTKPLSEKIIAGEFDHGDRVLVTAEEDRISFSKAEEKDK